MWLYNIRVAAVTMGNHTQESAHSPRCGLWAAQTIVLQDRLTQNHMRVCVGGACL